MAKDNLYVLEDLILQATIHKSVVQAEIIINDLDNYLFMNLEEHHLSELLSNIWLSLSTFFPFHYRKELATILDKSFRNYVKQGMTNAES